MVLREDGKCESYRAGGEVVEGVEREGPENDCEEEGRGEGGNYEGYKEERLDILISFETRIYYIDLTRSRTYSVFA